MGRDKSHMVEANIISSDLLCSVLYVSTCVCTCMLCVCVQMGPSAVYYFFFLQLVLKDKSLKHLTLNKLKSQSFHLRHFLHCRIRCAQWRGYFDFQSSVCLKLLVVRKKSRDSQGKEPSYYENAEEVSHPLDSGQISNGSRREPGSVRPHGI